MTDTKIIHGKNCNCGNKGACEAAEEAEEKLINKGRMTDLFSIDRAERRSPKRGSEPKQGSEEPQKIRCNLATDPTLKSCEETILALRAEVEKYREGITVPIVESDTLRAEVEELKEKNKWLMLEQGHSLECYVDPDAIRADLAARADRAETEAIENAHSYANSLVAHRRKDKELSNLRALLAETEKFLQHFVTVGIKSPCFSCGGKMGHYSGCAVVEVREILAARAIKGKSHD